MEEFNLFAHEERIADEACRTLADGKLSDDCKAALAPLLEGYRHLLHESKQLIRIADHRERDLNRLNRKLEALTQSLAYQATHDRLTGALNKGAISERIAQQLASAQCSLLLIDIDHFKQVNDSFGHLAGDRILKGLADRLQEILSDSETFGRFGGEEFVVISRETSLFKTRALAERLRRGAAEQPFDAGITEALSITLSIGFTLCEAGEALDAAIGRADGALYAAKRSGRNRVESKIRGMAEPDPEPQLAAPPFPPAFLKQEPS
ncbi:MAG: GGDEF domain-containing protein [Rhodocyclaceae bacterium]